LDPPSQYEQDLTIAPCRNPEEDCSPDETVTTEITCKTSGIIFIGDRAIPPNTPCDDLGVTPEECNDSSPTQFELATVTVTVCNSYEQAIYVDTDLLTVTNNALGTR